MSTDVVIIGQGYVGLPLAVRAAECGLSVVGLDLDARIVAALNDGCSHVDDVSNDILRRAIDQGYAASGDPAVIADADTVIVCVPTPLSDDGGPNLAAVIAAARTIGEHVQRGSLVVLESTTYPGTTEEIFAPLVMSQGLKAGEDIFIAFSPERIDPGNPVYGVHNTPKVVGGLTPECSTKAVKFYERLVEHVVLAKGAREAEMSKLLENTFRHVNIAMVNEMVRFCDDLEIDLWNAIDCAATKPFGYMAFRPGPGVGGHCIPVDPSYLSYRVRARLGYAFRMVELAAEINDAAPGYVASRAWRALNDLRKPVNGSTILLVGVTYKPDIADVRQSPATPLAIRLAEWGAHVTYFDELVPDWLPDGWVEAHPPSTHADVEQAAKAADLVILLQPHSDIDVSRLSRAAACLLDTRGVVPTAPNVIRL
ncbi:MAG TPA: nucleotide sugar dehydrogenase [Nocardioidaceae bacterium]|nr:nucleotide sugar dehydrogenase [Nocardioidaceae bacterium]